MSSNLTFNRLPFGLITDPKKLASAIAAVSEAGVRVDNAVHLTACSVLWHVRMYRNTTPMANLIAAMPKSSRLTALVGWLESNIPVKISVRQGTVELPRASEAIWEAYIQVAESKLISAMERPFWEFKKPVVRHAPDLDAIIAYLGKKAKDKHLDAATADKIAKIQSFAETMKG
jgi:hypothetical protein